MGVDFVDVYELRNLLGERVLLETPRYFYSGVLERVGDEWCVLSGASCVFNTGKFEAGGVFLREGRLPHGFVMLSVGSVIGVTVWGVL